MVASLRSTVSNTTMIAAVALLLMATFPRVASFQLRPSTPSKSNGYPLRPFTLLHSENPNKGGENIPAEEEVVGDQFEGSVDWDEEWKKVVSGRDQPTKRPGNYKSQAEIQAIKTTNKVAKNVFDAKSKLPSPPSIRSLQGDWKFW